MNYVLNVSKQKARLVDQHGRSCSVSIFLHSTDHPDSPPETLAASCNDPARRFLPVEIDDAIELVQIRAIQYLEFPEPIAEVERLRSVGACRAQVELSLSSGERLIGDIVYEAAPENTRVSDFLNSQGPRFVLLQSAGKTYLVHRRAIVRVKC